MQPVSSRPRDNEKDNVLPRNGKDSIYVSQQELEGFKQAYLKAKRLKKDTFEHFDHVWLTAYAKYQLEHLCMLEDDE